MNYDTYKRRGLNPFRGDEPWVCTCPNPITDELGECTVCHRKPRSLLLASSESHVKQVTVGHNRTRRKK